MCTNNHLKQIDGTSTRFRPRQMSLSLNLMIVNWTAHASMHSLDLPAFCSRFLSLFIAFSLSERVSWTHFERRPKTQKNNKSRETKNTRFQFKPERFIENALPRKLNQSKASIDAEEFKSLKSPEKPFFLINLIAS